MLILKSYRMIVVKSTLVIYFRIFFQPKALSIKDTPAQNGLAERKNRHVVETALALLQQAFLPSVFWYHSCATVTYLINKMPTSVLGMQSPF